MCFPKNLVIFIFSPTTSTPRYPVLTSTTWFLLDDIANPNNPSKWNDGVEDIDENKVTGSPVIKGVDAPTIPT